MQHRLDIVSFWGIAPGSRVLELGCGQGDTTVVLANAVGPTGHIDAVDPGAPDYGTPPLKDAQAHILSSPLGERITFHHASATGYAETYQGEKYDYIVLAHCIWYFESPAIFPALVKALAPHLAKGTKLCVAEWSLRSSSLASVPHVLTAILRSLIEAKRPEPSGANIRTVLSPKQITDAITEGSGLKLVKEVTMETKEEGMKDGYWEVDYTLRKRGADLGRFIEGKVPEAERVAIEGMYDAVQSTVDQIGGVKGVRCMDFWGAVFET
jgi:SAM-dependent methyltransferase